MFRKAELAAASDTTIKKCFRRVLKVLESFRNVFKTGVVVGGEGRWREVFRKAEPAASDTTWLQLLLDNLLPY